MELRVLRYFLTVAREENITRAAELLHITQPTLSRQLMQLEEELGTTLFHRGKHSIYLTEDGMLLKKRAQDIIALADRTEKEFTEHDEELSGEIVFGCGETKGVYELADRIAEFQRHYPMVQYEMYTAIADDIKEKIDRGLVDIGLLTEPVDISRYNFLRLQRREQWGALVRTDSPLAVQKTIKPEDLMGIPLLMVKRSLVKNEVANWFGKYYDQLEVVGTYNLLNNAAALVEKGIGTALCFQVGNYYDNLRFVPLEPKLETGLVLVWQKNRVLSRAAQMFIDDVKEYKNRC